MILCILKRCRRSSQQLFRHNASLLEVMKDRQWIELAITQPGRSLSVHIHVTSLN